METSDVRKRFHSSHFATLMSENDFGALASAILSDNRLCQHLREAPNADEFWRRLEVLAREQGLNPDFDAVRAMANGALSFWLTHWSGGGVG